MYDTEENITRNRHAGSLHKPLYAMSAASEESIENKPRIVAIPGITRSTVLADKSIPTIDIWGGQGTITAANYSTDVSSVTVVAANCFAQLNQTEFLDSRNITISNICFGVRNVQWPNDLRVASESLTKNPQASSVLLTDEVLAFCSQFRIFSYFQRILRLAQQSFFDLRSIDVTVENDPESENQWLTIVVQVHGEINEILDMFDVYTKKFVETTPWPAREKIRLTYDFV